MVISYDSFKEKKDIICKDYQLVPLQVEIYWKPEIKTAVMASNITTALFKLEELLDK